MLIVVIAGVNRLSHVSNLFFKTSSALKPLTSAVYAEEAEEDKKETEDKKEDKSASNKILDPMTMSDQELKILLSLSKQRKVLAKKEQEIFQREQLLKIAEQRIEDQIERLTNIKEKIDISLKTNEKENEQKIKGLVAIYENMKPDAASTIFNKLPLEVSLAVLEKMKTRKVSAILSRLDVAQAQRLTMLMSRPRNISLK